MKKLMEPLCPFEEFSYGNRFLFWKHQFFRHDGISLRSLGTSMKTSVSQKSLCISHLSLGKRISAHRVFQLQLAIHAYQYEATCSDGLVALHCC